MTSDFDTHILDQSIMNLFSNTFNGLDIVSSDIKREYRLLDLPSLSNYEREKINSIEGYSFAKEDEQNFLVSNPFGHISYKGRPIILYIRDQILPLEKYKRNEYNSFHICNCSAIKKAREENRFTGRYVITYNTTGLFFINISVSENTKAGKVVYDNIESKYVKLKVCEECLHYLGWNNFNQYIGDTDKWWIGGNKSKRKEIVRNFNIRHFLNECTNNLFSYEDYADLDYVSVATQKKRTLPTLIKRWLKQSSGYRCEICHKIFPENMLQIHHRDHNEGNNQRNNLVVICDKCHHELHLREDGIDNNHKDLDYFDGSLNTLNDISVKSNMLQKQDSVIVKNDTMFVQDTEKLVETADRYFNGVIVKQNIPKAKELYFQAANSGNIEAMLKLANIYSSDSDYTNAVKYLKIAAKLNSPEAQYLLACYYDKGQGVVSSSKEYAHWLKKAALQGHTEAEYKYANHLDWQNHTVNAFKFYSKAAEKGHIDACYQLGIFYYCGVGTRRNLEKAFLYYKKAADSGHKEAMYNLAKCYETGEGTVADYNQALKYLKCLAKDNDSKALFELGNYYYFGRGVEKNENKAFEWYKKAADNRSFEARSALKTYFFYNYTPGDLDYPKNEDYYEGYFNYDDEGETDYDDDYY